MSEIHFTYSPNEYAWPCWLYVAAGLLALIVVAAICVLWRRK